MLKYKVDIITVLEQSPVGDSSGNRFAERAVQQLEEVLRVHKLALETRLKRQMPVESCIMSWLVEHAADDVNKFLFVNDGTIAFE